MQFSRSHFVSRGISPSSASAVLTHASAAALLITGRVPGMPAQTSHTYLFGVALSGATAHPQNIFERVRGWTWTSMPITTSHSDKGDLDAHVARELVRARDAKRDVLAPRRRKHLETDGQALAHAARHADSG